MLQKNCVVEDSLVVPQLAHRITTEFSRLPQVVAITLAGSQTNDADELSDFDFYIYITAEISPKVRTEIARKFATQIEINNQFWEPGDEWIDIASGRGVDVMYRTPNWIEQQLERVLVNHQASVGYSTCLWWNASKSRPLYDRNGWFRHLQQQASQPYPEQLRRAIIAKNYPILGQNISAYTHQIESVLNRSDFVSVHHRITALIASYFDIVFAMNYLPHPGETWCNLLNLFANICQKTGELICKI